ncbi:NUDIX domain-containing protein [Paenibacillus sp. GSMTC-2017]|uniref:NUDIX hydrolase n=1 Tax=Paenibacillus sp. GSMTC-2017 TaxID=2794350 RepID=UPI0018D7858B|nr:NUDIX domain-containing protein [Paenibacillus sp. GSMTC-2017]MBH5316446.1 NUDIX domain-containing protein [Paenibacillus sp. GSMTC-2017]
MELLKELYERDLSLSGRDSTSRRHGNKFWFRRAVRAIIFNDKYEIALIHMSGDHYYKLPGGGIEAGETMEAALHREVLEELGTTVELTDEVGLIIEYRDEHELMQFSYCYIARMYSDQKNPELTEEEHAGGLSTGWVSLKEAIKIMEKNIPQTYVGKFIQERDLTFLKQLNR